ncbi:succinylglutamate desuccinylase/aspartoacylase family protein [Parerythrobacter lacustris]|uniref:Succinylglutamate desuccinylase/aspartoacylase family protein n=1 Tax=Parerythrobacter lacustris TaxID=2969984 RepID=A0ABT1XSA4_9SPHN|nr:succinylglutamate desuccinylase/aspartoacylase family protein [Parerythrobacter lacustris]MCR2834534.1 succinylglutamate desuccinylase/aspartoacylase family protein [Parerythrobacter lacustris]
MGESVEGAVEFEIGGEIVPPGERRIVAIPVSQQVSGLSANLALQVVHGAQPGPVVFVSGAIHGDEIIGTAVIQRLSARLDPQRLAGTVILAPAVNIFGFLQHSRYLPDRRDLNRSFPGSRKGSLAGQLAWTFLEHVIGRCSLGIDIHSAAIHRYNLPQIRIAAGSPYLVELAMAFGAPVIIESPLRDGSMRALAQGREVPMLLMEAGEALRFDRLSIDIGVSGVCRVLAHIGMIEADDGLSHVGIPARANKSSWVRAPRGGVTHRERKSGDIVHKGDLLATVGGLFGEGPMEMVSPIDGIIIGHATLPVVNQGDALFHIAEVAQLEHAGERIGSITEAILASEPEGPAQPLMDEDEVI